MHTGRIITTQVAVTKAEMIDALRKRFPGVFAISCLPTDAKGVTVEVLDKGICLTYAAAPTETASA